MTDEQLNRVEVMLTELIELVGSLEFSMKRGFGQMDRRFDAVDKQLDKIEFKEARGDIIGDQMGNLDK